MEFQKADVSTDYMPRVIHCTYCEIVSRFFRKNKSGHLVAGSQPAMISDSRSSSAFKR